MNEYDKAFYYTSLCILDKTPIDKKKNVLLLGSQILHCLLKSKESEIFKRNYENIRKGIDCEFYVIRDICKNFLLDMDDRYSGTIKKILNNKLSGFIENDDNTIYFRMNNVLIRKVNEGDKVTFKLIESYDKKKQKKSFEAIEIIKK